MIARRYQPGLLQSQAKSPDNTQGKCSDKRPRVKGSSNNEKAWKSL